eukprot:1070502_1
MQMWQRDSTGRLVRRAFPSNKVNEASNATTLEDLIQLRLAMDKLTDTEWIRFKNEWFRSLDRNTICSSIYHYLDHNKIANSTYNLNTIQQTVSKIIKSRRETLSTHSSNDDIMSIKELTLEPKSVSLSPSYCIKLNHLPKALIGDIASYLDWGSYMKLELSSRQMYVGCNSPSTLQALTTPVPRNLSNIPFYDYTHDFRSKFPLLKVLITAVPYLNQYMQCHRNQPFNHLTTLRMMQVFSTDLIQEFMTTNNLINCSDITTLICDTVMDVQHGTLMDNVGQVMLHQAFNSSMFYDFLAQFTHLQELQFVNVLTTWNDDLDIDELYELLPYLRRFVSKHSTAELVDAIIAIYGDQLESLVLSSHDCSFIECEEGFPNLVELSIPQPPFPVLHDMLEKPTRLERFGLITDCNNMDSFEMVHLFRKLLTTQASLHYIGIDVHYAQFGTIMNAIRVALSTTRHVERKEVTIGLHVLQCNEVVISKANMWITQMMAELRRTSIRNFMVDVGFSNEENIRIDNRNARNRMCRVLRNTYSVVHETYGDGYEIKLRFVVTNKNCSINGYRARWLLHQ